MYNIVVIGGGGHAKVLISVLKKIDYYVIGYTDLKDRAPILGAPCLGNDTILGKIVVSQKKCCAIIGVGKIDGSDFRLRLQAQVEHLGFYIPVIISSGALINEETRLGAGTVVFDGVVVNSGAVTGKACILNSNCTVEHDCRISDNVHIAPGVTLSGNVTIGNNSMIGVGATVIQGVTICEDCLVGAGATVVKDITVPGTYIGNPAKKIK